MTLTEFLTARLDEDEAAARAATAGPWEIDHPTSRQVVFRGRSSAAENLLPEVVVYDSGFGSDADAEFVARHDPARVLAEVEAKRRIVAEAWDNMVEEEQYWAHQHGRPAPTRADLELRGEAPYMLNLLALPYADHPDYDEEWRP